MTHETLGLPSRFERVKTDADKAVDYRDKLTKLQDRVCEVLNQAARDGLEASFTLQRDQSGRWSRAPIHVVRPL